MSNSYKYSSLKIVNFPEKIQSFKTGQITAPIYVRVKPTNICNHDCYWCAYKESWSGMHELSPDRETDYKGTVAQLSRDKLLEVLEDFRDMGVRAVTYSGGGEPLAHKNIVEVMQQTLIYGIDLSIITNGQLLFGDRAHALAGAKWVRISMDYFDGPSIKASRGTAESAYDTIMKNIENFSQIKHPNCDLGVNFVITKDNYHQIENITEKLCLVGVDNIRFSPVYTKDFVQYHEAIAKDVIFRIDAAKKLYDAPGFRVYSSYDFDTQKLTRGYTKCLFMQVVPVVAADGGVYACHNKAYDTTGLIGSIADRRFRELWFSNEAKAVFEGLNPQHDCNHQCAADSKNIALNSIVESAGDNFV